MENIIEVSAPIQIEDLKKYFENKETVFIINYTESQLKEEKLLIYLGNLDIPCDIKFSTIEEIKEMVSVYLNHTSIVNIPILENIVISLLLQKKEILELVNKDLINDLNEELSNWCKKLESLPLYNMYTIQDEDIKNWVIEEHEEDPTEDYTGINFVSLLKHTHFFDFYQKITTEKPKYYSNYFNKNMFKGTNLYSYWANENNPMFLLTYGIASGELDVQEYVKNLKENISELHELEGSNDTSV